MTDYADATDLQQPMKPEERKHLWAGLQSKADQYVKYRDPKLKGEVAEGVVNAMREDLAAEIFDAMNRDAKGLVWQRLPPSLRTDERIKTEARDCVSAYFAKNKFTFAIGGRQTFGGSTYSIFENDTHLRAYIYKSARNAVADQANINKWNDEARKPGGSVDINDDVGQDAKPTFDPGQKNDGVPLDADGAYGGDEETNLEKAMQLKALRHLIKTELSKGEKLAMMEDLYCEGTQQQKADRLGIPRSTYTTRLKTAIVKLQNVYRDLPSRKDDEPPEETPV